MGNKIIWYINFFISGFFISCRTPLNEKLVIASRESDIYFVSDRLNNLCLESRNPQILLEVIPSNSNNSNIQMEGVWKENFKVLNLQILGAFGEQYAYFQVNEHNSNIFSARESILNNNEIKNIFSFVSSLGAQNLREIFCGFYPFEKDSKIFVKNDSVNKEQKFFSKKVIEIQDHSVEIHSHYTLKPGIEDGFDITIESKYMYGLFSKNVLLTINWSGHLNDVKVSPKFIDIQYNQDIYKLKILDYN